VVLDEVERKAREATPGPWELLDPESDWSVAGVVAECRDDDHEVWVVTDGPIVEEGRDAAHIAAADPPSVLAMAEALRVAREALGWAGERGCPDAELKYQLVCYEGLPNNPYEWCDTCVVNVSAAAMDSLIDFGSVL
jgi:hypothetical protein